MADGEAIDRSAGEEEDPLIRLVAAAPPRAPPGDREVLRRRIGTALGRYRIDDILGVGGMAVVYRATHVNNGAQRAIKMLLPEHSANEDLRRRFRREGRLAIQVDHPGVVLVIDDDVSEDGAAFLVLELLKGVPCHDLATKAGGRFSPPAACGVGLQVLDVLQAAHRRGIIHRDVKPANLFVLEDGTVKVLDFGIASVRQTIRGGGQTTQSGSLLGTPDFMAPEQGYPGTIDERADLWAVGATLLTLLTGRTVARPSPVPLAKLAPELAGAIADVVDRALTVDPERRWPSAAAMHGALVSACRLTFGAPPDRATLAAFRETALHGGDTAAVSSDPGTLVSAVALAPPRDPAAGAPRPSPPSPMPEGRWLGAGAGVCCVLALAWAAATPWRAPPPRRNERPVPSSPVVEDEPRHPPVPLAPPAVVTLEAPPRIPTDAPVRSCAEARRAGRTGDGYVTLDPDGPGPIAPFEVFCKGMAEDVAPREYLFLPHGPWSQEPEANTTRYVRDGKNCLCPDLVRVFHAVRIDPADMTVDPKDGTYAEYVNRDLACEESHRNQCGERQDLAWGGAGSCRPDREGRATLDLRGTPFALAEASFTAAGLDARSHVSISGDGKTASLVAAGRCGWAVPREESIPLVAGR